MDASLFRWVNHLADRTGWAHGTLVAYAKYGIVLFAVLVLAGWWQARADGGDGAPERVVGIAWAGAAALVALALNQAIGHAVDRSRPFVAMPHAHLLVSHTRDFSFPSDHAAAVGAVAVGLLLVVRRLGVVALVLAVLMAFARVYVGVHYPGDVVGGLAVGAAVAVGGAPLAHRIGDPLARRLARGPARPLLTR